MELSVVKDFNLSLEYFEASDYRIAGDFLIEIGTQIEKVERVHKNCEYRFIVFHC